MMGGIIAVLVVALCVIQCQEGGIRADLRRERIEARDRAHRELKAWHDCRTDCYASDPQKMPRDCQCEHMMPAELR